MSLSNTAISDLAVRTPMNVRLNDKTNEIASLSAIEGEIFLNVRIEGPAHQ